MKNSLVLLLCVLMTAAATAQVNLNGTISDQKTHEQLAGAVVAIPELKRGTAADADGSFRFTHLPRGNYLITVNYIGYASLSVPIKLFRDTSIAITLAQTAAELENVVVTGVSKATEAKESPMAISLISQKQLQSATATNLVDAIAKLPGVSAISTGAAISKPVIRGLGYNRVVTLYDGFRQEGQQWGDEHGIEIDEADVGHVEILRGPGSLLYGSDAIAGVINFIPAPPIEEGKIGAEALLNYQSNNNLISSSIMTEGNLHGLIWRLRGSNKTAGDYRNAYDGKVWNSGFREWDMNGRIGLTKKWGYSILSLSTFHQNIGFNEGTRDSAGFFMREVAVEDSVVAKPATGNDLKGYSIYTPHQRVAHHRIAWQNKIYIGSGNLTVDASWQLNERKELGDVQHPDKPDLSFQMHTATLSMQYHLPEMKEWSTTVGWSGMFQANKNRGSEFLIPAYQSFDYGVFAITRRKFKKSLLEAGLRFDQRFYHSQSLYLDGNGQATTAADTSADKLFPDIKRMFWSFSGSLGWSYQANENWSIKLNIAKGFRVPTAAELAANGQHEGAFRYEYGNENLRPESDYQIDAGIDYTSEHVNFSASVFEHTILHYISMQKLRGSNGSDSLLATPSGSWIPAFQYRQNTALLAGVEITLDLHPHPADWLHFENTFGYVYAVSLHQPDSAKYLPFTPPAHYRSELRFDIPKTGSRLRGLSFGLHFDYYFPQNHVLWADHTETPTPDYALLGATVGFDCYTGQNRKIFSFLFAAENLTNTTYQSHLSRLKYLALNPANGKTGIWNMGRNFSVKIIVPLQFPIEAKGNKRKTEQW